MPITYDKKTKWPPTPHDKAIKKMEEWAAWYSSDVEKLEKHYQKHPNQQRFWGRKNTQQATRHHYPAAGNISRASSDLLFSSTPRIEPPEHQQDDKQLAERIDLIFGEESYGNELLEAAETCSAFGGVFLRPWWDVEVADHVVPSHIDADNAVPEFVYNRLQAVTFWTVVSHPGENATIRHLERHEKGMIYHALFEGDETTLGERKPLDSHPATQWAADIADKEGGIKTGIDRIAVVYIPNVRPSRGWRHIPQLKQLGRSDYEGLESEFDALDETYSSWIRDIELAKGRILIDEMLLDDLGPGRGGAFDMDKQVFTKLKPSLGDGSGGPTIEQIQFGVRWQEHAQTIAEILTHIIHSCGLSAQNFSNGQLSVGNVTATEVDSRNSVIEGTRKKKLAYWRAGLTEFVQIVMDLDHVHFGSPKLDGAPQITFAPSPHQSESTQAQTIEAKRRAGVMSRETGIKIIHPEWTQDQVDAEIERIYTDMEKETKIQFGGGAPDEGGEDDLSAGEGFVDETQIDVFEELLNNLDEPEPQEHEG